ncbi:protein TRACHEARY ELEMENT DIFFERENTIATION-RELATED 7A-like [Schistocerca americana]|uniref:protein TRACHEARY ELEMENT DIFFERENTIATION-RELATED 7A-like n=1 Tax=Schistocerca americana TaxID=7009 RepID=UPI001F4F90C5|nr:protein TRACHEARY ELEMENT DIFFERENTIATION-RELATED 7A-like [Schistocerca americana]
MAIPCTRDSSPLDMTGGEELEASRFPPPQPTTPPTAPPPLAPPPRALLPPLPLPVRSPARGEHLSRPPWPHLRQLPLSPPSLPQCSSAVSEPMDAEAATTPPPSISPMEIVAPPPHPTTPRYSG